MTAERAFGATTDKARQILAGYPHALLGGAVRLGSGTEVNLSKESTGAAQDRAIAATLRGIANAALGRRAMLSETDPPVRTPHHAEDPPEDYVG